MLPFEFTATPEASPRCMSGGSLMKFGTESKLSSGADVDCAKADGLISTKSPASNRFMRTSLGWRVRRCCGWTLRTPPPMAASIQTGGVTTQSIVGRHAREDEMLKMAFSLAMLVLMGVAASADPVADFYRGRQVSLIVGYGTGGG